MYDFVDKLKKEKNPFTSKITSSVKEKFHVCIVVLTAHKKKGDSEIHKVLSYRKTYRDKELLIW